MTPEQYGDIHAKLGTLLERTANTCLDISAIKKEISGNGQKGIKQRLDDLEAHKNKTVGAMAILAFIGTGTWGFLEWVFHIKKMAP